MTLNTKLQMSVRATLESALDLAEASVPLSHTYATTLLTGTGAGQADRIFHDRRTLNASATEDLDLAGVLLDAFGTAITFARIKGLIVAAAAANVNNVIVGGAASNGFVGWVSDATDKVVVRPGATLALFAGEGDAAGYAVTAGTADILKIANSGAGTPVTYDVVLVGASA